MTPDADCNCGLVLVMQFAAMGVEVTASTLPPIVQTSYEDLRLRCPHGVRWYPEPTGNQIAAWARDGVA